MRPEVLRGAEAHVHAQLGRADHERVAHVVAGVAEVAERDLGDPLVHQFGHRQDVGQDLRRVELVGQAVPRGNAGVLAELLDRVLREAAVLDAVVHPAEHAGGVPHRFLVADLRAAGPEIRDVGALVVGCHLERRASPGGRLLEDHRDVLALESLLFIARVLRGLEIGGELQEEPDLLGGDVEQRRETSISQVETHRGSSRVGSADGSSRRRSAGASREPDEMHPRIGVRAARPA